MECNRHLDGAPPTAVDLFCGAGGLSLGLAQAGFSIVAAHDKWRPAADTYRLNFDDHVVCSGITEDIDLPHADVLVGGPPCQGFSSAGLRRPDDRRNTLVRVYSRIIQRLRPVAFIFENVEGFLTGSQGSFVFDLLEPVIEAGYRVQLRKINAANYGVPQHRKRVVAIGGLGWDPTFPEPTHSAYGAPGADLGGTHLPRTPSFGQALAGLPPAVARGNCNFCDDHTYTPLKEDDFARAKLLKPGQRMRDLPEELWHPSYRRRAYRRVMDGTPTERRGGAPAGVRRLSMDEPSKAITGGALSEFLHPLEDRPLTIRECARIQTFPDTFRFSGTVREVIQLVGNAVPPLLAWRLGESLRQDLQSAQVGGLPGTLLSFVPTLSLGMSPALEAVEKAVRGRFCGPTSIVQGCFQWD
jgi:DNA (cytosine-5)-methyltransferase 1